MYKRQAFKKVGIDASWEENTPEIDLQYKVQQFEQLTKAQSYEIQEELIYNNKSALETFKQNLCLSLERRIESIRILSVYGNQIVFNSAQEACNYIANFYEDVNSAKFYKFEIYIKYSNRDKIEMQFQNKENAIQFLQRFI